jgi:hypothetical protein
MKEISYHFRCNEEDRDIIKKELKIRSAINSMSPAKYIINLLKITKRELQK